jgi:hypothetical protein
MSRQVTEMKLEEFQDNHIKTALNSYKNEIKDLEKYKKDNNGK